MSRHSERTPHPRMVFGRGLLHNRGRACGHASRRAGPQLRCACLRRAASAFLAAASGSAAGELPVGASLSRRGRLGSY
jgi:hypothetical protein